MTMKPITKFRLFIFAIYVVTLIPNVLYLPFLVIAHPFEWLADKTYYWRMEQQQKLLDRYGLDLYYNSDTKKTTVKERQL